jgi:hypothetical protein
MSKTFHIINLVEIGYSPSMINVNCVVKSNKIFGPYGFGMYFPQCVTYNVNILYV